MRTIYSLDLTKVRITLIVALQLLVSLFVQSATAQTTIINNLTGGTSQHSSCIGTYWAKHEWDIIFPASYRGQTIKNPVLYYRRGSNDNTTIVAGGFTTGDNGSFLVSTVTASGLLGFAPPGTTETDSYYKFDFTGQSITVPANGVLWFRFDASTGDCSQYRKDIGSSVYTSTYQQQDNVRPGYTSFFIQGNVGPAPTIATVLPASVNGSAPPIITITGTNFTGATSVTYGVNGTGSTSTAFTVVSPTQLTFQPGTLTPGTCYKVIVVGAGGPSVASTQTFCAIAPPVATITASGPTTFCQGSSVALTVPTATSYQWNVDGSPINGQTANTYTATTGGSYTVTVTNSIGVAATSAATVVTVNPLPIATASNSGPIPSGATINLNASGGDTYSWTGPNNFTSTLQNPSITNATTANAGTYTVTVSQNGCTATSSTVVVVNTTPGGALSFNGSNYVNINNPFTAFEKEITVEWTADISQSNPVGSGIGQSTFNIDGTNSMVWLMHFAAPNIEFYISDNGTWKKAYAAVPAGWHHWTGVANANGIYLYMDGVLVNTNTSGVSGRILNVPNAVINLGKDVRYATGRFFTGKMDEIRIWSRALCAGEIQNNVNGELSGPQTGLEEYYKLNQGNANDINSTVTTAVESSGNNRTGTLVNFALTGTAANWIPGAITGTASPFVQPTATVTANGPLSFCPSGSVVFTANGGSGLTYQWLKNHNGITGASSATYTATGGGIYNVIVTNNGCSTTSADQVVVVQDLIPPVFTSTQANMVVALDGRGNASLTNYATLATATDNCSLSGITQSPLAGTALVANVPTTVTLTATDASGNTTTQTFTVTATDQTAPVALTKNITVNLDAAGNASITPASVDNGSTDNVGITTYSLDKLTFDCSNVGAPVTVTLTVTDAAGNSSTGNATVTVNDVTPPVTPVLADVTGQCSATAAVATATDACAGTIVGTTIDPLTYNAQGNYVIHWSFDDGHGNITSATQNVIIKDVTAPVVPVLTDVTSECSATATAPTTTDNCAGIVTGTTSDPLTYTTQGTHVITWSFNDGNGNVSTATQNVIIKDVTPPVVPVLADVTGECSATATAPTTTDNCAGIVTGTTTDPLTYTTQGTHVITWSFNDGNGNVSTAAQNVIIKDVTPPVVPVLADVTGECSATATVPTTTDNCAGTVTGTTSDPLTYTTQGTHVITWSFDDGHGNITTATQNVIIKDVTPPVVPVLADVTGECSATATVPTTTDNCAGTVTGTTSDPLTYTTQGTHVITWSFNDGNGNVSTAMQNVIIKDVTPPVVPVLADVTGECSATATVPVTTDNCAGTVTGTTTDPLTYTTQGTYVIMWSFNDGNGNVTVAKQNVVIKDITAPVVLTKNITVNLNDAGQVSILPSDVDNGSSDNCGIVTLALSKSAFDCSNLGLNTVTVTADDGHGNISTGTATVTVKDVIPATVLTQNISVTLVNGAASITAAKINNGSFDNCGIKSYSVSPSTFACGQYGDNTVTLTVVDNSGNTSSATAIVTVKGVAPVPAIAISRADNTYTGLPSNTIALGYGAQSVILTAGNTTSALGATHYNWSPSAGLSSTTIANPVFKPTAAGTYTFDVTATNEFGCTATASVSVIVTDVRCGNNNDKVVVCHDTGSGSNPFVELCISTNAVDTHLASGDKLGSCGAFVTAPSASTTLAAQTTPIKLVAYPNPFSTSTTVAFSVPTKDKNVVVEAYNSFGIKVASLFSGSLQANVEQDVQMNRNNLQLGVYFLRLTSSSGVQTFRLSIQ